MTTNTMALSVSQENYLETILLLIRTHAVARSRDIAARMKVTRASVTGALQALGERGLVNYEPYGFVTLTASGEAAAVRVLGRHEVLRDFFINVLAIEQAEADEAACRMEHGISKHIVDRLVDFAEFVEKCPRAGNKWVRGLAHYCATAPKQSAKECEACMNACLDDFRKNNEQMKHNQVGAQEEPLSKLNPGKKGLIARIAGASAVKRRITDMGVTKGTLIEIIRVAPMGDPIEVKIKGYHLSLRKEEAAEIFVRPV